MRILQDRFSSWPSHWWLSYRGFDPFEDTARRRTDGIVERGVHCYRGFDPFEDTARRAICHLWYTWTAGYRGFDPFEDTASCVDVLGDVAEG